MNGAVVALILMMSSVASPAWSPQLKSSLHDGEHQTHDADVANADDLTVSGETPLRLREDILPWTSFAGGMGLTISGILVSFIGAWPVLNILRDQAVLSDVLTRSPQEGDQSLIAFRTAAIYDQHLAFRTRGAPVLAIGIGMSLCGALIAVGGLYAGIQVTQGE